MFHNTVMIYNTRNRNNDTKESQKEKKTILMLFSIQSVKNHGTKITYTSQYCMRDYDEVF